MENAFSNPFCDSSCSKVGQGAIEASVGGVTYACDTATGMATVQRADKTAVSLSVAAEVETGGRTYRTTAIGSFAFCGCTRLLSVDLPEGITDIGDNAFRRCSALGLILLPATVTRIGGSAFCGCCALTTVSLPEGVVSIGGSAFEMCNRLTTVSLPASLAEIGDHAFYGCTSLVSATVPEGVTELSWCVFADCSHLTSVSIPQSVTHIGNDAFCGCRQLTKVDIPDCVTRIGFGAFCGCLRLASITLPETLTGIGDSAFSECSHLSEVVCLARSVPVCPGNAFDGACPEGCTLAVPADLVEAYRAAPGWSLLTQVKAI